MPPQAHLIAGLAGALDHFVRAANNMHVHNSARDPCVAALVRTDDGFVRALGEVFQKDRRLVRSVAVLADDQPGATDETVRGRILHERVHPTHRERARRRRCPAPLIEVCLQSRHTPNPAALGDLAMVAPCEDHPLKFGRRDVLLVILDAELPAEISDAHVRDLGWLGAEGNFWSEEDAEDWL